MLFKAKLAPICYVILGSILTACSGQNLKGQSVKPEDQTSKPADVTQKPGPAQQTSNQDYTRPAQVPKEIAGSFLAQCEALDSSRKDIGCNLYSVDQQGQTQLANPNYSSKLIVGYTHIQGTSGNGKFQKIYALKNSNIFGALSDESQTKLEVGFPDYSQPVYARVFVAPTPPSVNVCKSGGKQYVGDTAVLSEHHRRHQYQDKYIFTQSWSAQLDEKDKNIRDQNGNNVYTIAEFKSATINGNIALNSLTNDIFGEAICFQSPIFRIILEKSDSESHKLIDIDGVQPVEEPNCQASTSMGKFPTNVNYSCYLYSLAHFSIRSGEKITLNFQGGVPKYHLFLTSSNYVASYFQKPECGGLAGTFICGIKMTAAFGFVDNVKSVFQSN